MRTFLAGALAAGSLLLPALPAGAAGGHELEGGCGFKAFNGWGAVYAVGVAYSSIPEDNPVTVDVTCELRVNGVAQHTSVHTGTVVLAGVAHLDYYADWDDVVELCETVDFRHTNGTPETKCTPGQEALDLVGDVVGMLDDVWAATGAADPYLCPLLAARAPGPPPVEITPQGDVYLAGELWWDCPPYETA